MQVAEAHLEALLVNAARFSCFYSFSKLRVMSEISILGLRTISTQATFTTSREFAYWMSWFESSMASRKESFIQRGVNVMLPYGVQRDR